MAGGRAGAAWAGSVGLMACVAVGRTSVGGAATQAARRAAAVSYTHLRAHETVLDLVCRLLLAKKKKIVSYLVDSSLITK